MSIDFTSIKKGSLILAQTSAEQRNLALQEIIKQLRAKQDEILQANADDLNEAKASQISEATLARLKFDVQKMEQVISGIMQLVDLPDPVGQIVFAKALAPQLNLYRVQVPLGVVGVIFEARPDALVQIASLCLKSGNAVVLKGGSEAKRTNACLAACIQTATASIIEADWLLPLVDRTDVTALLTAKDSIDLIIPRGSNAFVQYIMQHTTIPVLGHADGVCHTYVDQAADIPMALSVVIDAKTQYPSVCNATETLLVHQAIAETFLDQLIPQLNALQVKIYGDDWVCCRYQVQPVQDWHHEYLDLGLSIGVVNDVDHAMAHISQYGSRHTEAILTMDSAVAEHFLKSVDAGNVFWNCSTRFSDGYRYGFGAEVGVSTHKIHARGPVGLEGLMTYKYQLLGQGHCVAPFVSGELTFLHQPLAKDHPFPHKK